MRPITSYLIILLSEELQVPDQVGQTELHDRGALFHEFAVGAEIVAVDHAGKGLAEHLIKHLGAAGVGDEEQNEGAGPEAPGPVPLAVVFVPGFIDAELILFRQQSAQFFIGCGQCGGDLPGRDLGDEPGADMHPEHISQQGLDVGVGHMTSALEKRDVGRESRADQPGGPNLLRQSSAQHLLGMPVTIAPRAVFGNLHRRFLQLDLLHHIPFIERFPLLRIEPL